MDKRSYIYKSYFRLGKCSLEGHKPLSVTQWKYIYIYIYSWDIIHTIKTRYDNKNRIIILSQYETKNNHTISLYINDSEYVLQEHVPLCFLY